MAKVQREKTGKRIGENARLRDVDSGTVSLLL